MKMARNSVWMIVVALGAAVLLAAAAPARADWHGRWHDRGFRDHDWHGWNNGLFFGLNFGPDYYNPPVVYGPPVIYNNPPVVYSPAPVVTQTWVPGHYESRTTQVLVQPGHYEDHHVDRVVETRYPANGGPPQTVVIQQGGVQRVWVPDRYENRTTQVWVPGHYETATGTVVAPAPAPVVVSPPPAQVHVGIGGIFHF